MAGYPMLDFSNNSAPLLSVPYARPSVVHGLKREPAVIYFTSHFKVDSRQLPLNQGQGVQRRLGLGID